MNRSSTMAVLVCATLFATTGELAAQVPNAGFETWTGSDPTGWSTSNTILGNTVTKSTTAHGGAASAQLTVITIPPGMAFGPTIQSGVGARGFGVSQRYAVFSGFYQFVPIGGDRMTFIASMYKSGSAIGIGAISISTPAASWTPFQVTIGYHAAGIPDTCVINASIIGPVTGTDYHVNSTGLVDDFSLSGTDFVAQGDRPVPDGFALEQNYPNPFNPVTHIQFTTVDRQSTSVMVYDFLGREVSTLVNEVKDPGSYTVPFDGSGLATGVYYCRLTAGGFVRTRSMILVR